MSLYQKYLLSFARLSFRNLDIILIDNIFEKLSEEELDNIKGLILKEYVKTGTTTVLATTSNEIAKVLTKRIIKFNLGSIEN